MSVISFAKAGDTNRLAGLGLGFLVIHLGYNLLARGLNKKIGQKDISPQSVPEER